MENEQIAAVEKRAHDLGFPRDDQDFKHKITVAVQDALALGQPQKVFHDRERSQFEITIAPGVKKNADKIYINSIQVSNAKGENTLRFPTGGFQPTLKAMENAANNKWIMLANYQPKDETKAANDVWFRLNKEGKKEWVSDKDFTVCREGHEILGYKLTADDVKELQKGNSILTNDCLRFEKGSNVPVGKTENTVSLYPDPAGNRIGYNELDKKVDLKKNFQQKSSNGVDVTAATAKAAQQSKQETETATVSTSRKHNKR